MLFHYLPGGRFPNRNSAWIENILNGEKLLMSNNKKKLISSIVLDLLIKVRKETENEMLHLYTDRNAPCNNWEASGNAC